MTCIRVCDRKVKLMMLSVAPWSVRACSASSSPLLLLAFRGLSTGHTLHKTTAGVYKVTVDRRTPLTYEMAFKPDEIARKKGFNSHNTAQLEGTFLEREQIGQDLPHKMFVEDLFIRQFVRGTFPEHVASEVIIKRQHNLVRVAFALERKLQPGQVYFLLGYTEEMLAHWLKCPVKLELQTVDSKDDLVYKYI